MERVDGDIWYLPFSRSGHVSEGRKMEKKCMDRLIGKYCKIVTKEPGEDRAYVVTGMVKDIDQNAGFIIIESEQGPDCLNIKAIVAIKPKVKR